MSMQWLNGLCRTRQASEATCHKRFSASGWVFASKLAGSLAFISLTQLAAIIYKQYITVHHLHCILCAAHAATQAQCCYVTKSHLPFLEDKL